jgi:hypothetical protein
VSTHPFPWWGGGPAKPRSGETVGWEETQPHPTRLGFALLTLATLPVKGRDQNERKANDVKLRAR